MKISTLIVLLALISLGSLSNATAGTDIYQHVDKEGNITFTNRNIKNAQKISIASFSRNSESTHSKLSSNPSHGKDVKQKERDAMRRHILEKELLTEKKLLSDTQNFIEQINHNPQLSNSQEAVIQLKNKFFLHQRNITALKKELAKL
ncbi:MAG TPA: DUF4124 domain-containing protein [Gammaproteobacteria bacterium]|jgi:hypothetical protein|nr:DUF4124 domain-containing protein [Nitrosomonas sp.]MBP7953766.1 DUF4124 domain-containing protein [Nitrosomonas sp.]HQY22689.1 DUF4124 domain-containing protein [Gammaproteobacteria bacterium]